MWAVCANWLSALVLPHGTPNMIRAPPKTNADGDSESRPPEGDRASGSPCSRGEPDTGLGHLHSRSVLANCRQHQEGSTEQTSKAFCGRASPRGFSSCLKHFFPTGRSCSAIGRARCSRSESTTCGSLPPWGSLTARSGTEPCTAYGLLALSAAIPRGTCSAWTKSGHWLRRSTIQALRLTSLADRPIPSDSAQRPSSSSVASADCARTRPLSEVRTKQNWTPSWRTSASSTGSPRQPAGSHAGSFKRFSTTCISATSACATSRLTTSTAFSRP